MLIGEIIESVYLKVNAFKPSTDSSVLRADIRAMLPVAVNYAADFAYNENIKIEGDRDLPSEFYAVYENIPINRTGNMVSINLQKGTMPLKGNSGIRFVYDDCGNFYAPLSDTAFPMIGYYKNITSGMFWYRRQSQKLVLYGTNPIISSLNYQAISDVASMSDEDEAPIQAGKEMVAVEWLIKWFSKDAGYDNKIDSRDDSNAIPYK